MTVVPFTPPSFMEFEGRALKKITQIVRALPAIVDAHAKLLMSDGCPESAQRVLDAFELVEFIDRTIEHLENEAAPLLVRGVKSDVLDQVLEIQCNLTNLRMKAFTEIRSSRLFVNDFTFVIEDREYFPALFAA